MTHPLPDPSAPDVPTPLFGRRILIVEDDALIGMDLLHLLTDEGMIVVGPARNISHARQLATEGEFHMALLDANLGGEPVEPIAEILSARNVPFAYCTGYDRDELPEGRNGRPILSKPFGRDALLAVVTDLSRSSGSGPSAPA